MMALGSTLRSAEPTAPRVPAGAIRRPFRSTRVRVAPRPRSERVLAPGPPSVTKPPKALLICEEPAVAGDDEQRVVDPDADADHGRDQR